MKFFQDLMKRRALNKREKLLRLAETLHKRAVALACDAYYIDHMVEPLRWARVYNASLWAKHHSDRCRRDAHAIKVTP